MSLLQSQKLQYLLWAATSSMSSQEHQCPACTSVSTTLVRRKYLVTSLRECESCGLRFRSPKDNAAEAHDFYQESYSQGFTTDCPSEEALSALIANNFSGSEKDFQSYINVLKAAGMAEGDSILDFGASWGYGSWQFRKAGFRVFSQEISKPRAEYARTRLACNMIESIDRLPERVKCFFTAHVIEHLPDPRLIWEVASQVLTDDGIIVCFCPNGDPARESLQGLRLYDHIWGKVHPMLITPRFVRNMSAQFGFHAYVYSRPYRLDQISNSESPSEIIGDELCLIARRALKETPSLACVDHA